MTDPRTSGPAGAGESSSADGRPMQIVADFGERVRAALARIPQPALVAGILIGLLELLRVATATLWRDEYQTWMLAKDASGLLGLIDVMRYEGHPPFFEILLLPLAHTSLPPASGKLLVLAFGAVSLWLLFRERRVPLGIRIAVALSIVWGETLLVRSYVLLPALLLGAAAVRGDGTDARRRVMAYGLVGLAAFTHSIAMVVGGVMVVRWLLRQGMRGVGRTIASDWPGLAIAGTLALGALIVVRSAVDREGTFAGLTPLSFATGFELLGGFARPALAILPAWTVALVCILPLIAALSGTARWAFLLALAGTFGLGVYSGVGKTRMLVALLVLWVILLAEGPAVRMRLQSMGLAASGAILAAVGIVVLPLLTLQPASRIGEAADAVRGRMPHGSFFIATPDWLGTGLSAELNVRVWTPECGCEIGAIRWDRTRNQSSSRPHDMEAKAIAKAAEVAATGRTVVLALPPGAVAPPSARLLALSTGGRHAEEDSAIYLIAAP